MELKEFSRSLHLNQFNSSLFLLGPRMVGKTSLLKTIKSSLSFDLLDVELELKLRQDPKSNFFEKLHALPKGSTVIVDEIQKIPALLNYVQMGIENYQHKFILSGSSARKLKRQSSNLLGGRAVEVNLHPLSFFELQENFKMENCLQFGTLPKVQQLILADQIPDAQRLLRTYHSLYLKTEIQEEALTRNLSSFQRFLYIAAQANAQTIQYSNISRESATPMSTVKEYFSILEDTLIGNFLWQWQASERSKSRPKFYFFDCGVLRAVQNRLNDPPTPDELGFLFETWFLRELIKINDYQEKSHRFCFWRKDNEEVDILVESGSGLVMAFECKAGLISKKDFLAAKKFQATFPQVPLYFVSLKEEHPRKTAEGFEILPWKQALDLYQKL